MRIWLPAKNYEKISHPDMRRDVTRVVRKYPHDDASDVSYNLH